MAAKFKRLGGAANDAGTQFELKTAALLHLRARNCAAAEEFQLATNVDGAGALDDIVFKVKSPGQPWAITFVQLKHKDDNKSFISLNKLKNTGKNSMFSLVKYFNSFIEIKQAMSVAGSGSLFEGSIEHCRFIIFTNAKAAESLGRGRSVSSGSVGDELLGSATGTVVCFDPVSNATVYQELFDFLTKECQEDDRQWVKFFLEHLQVFCSQSSPHALDDPIKKELNKLSVESNKDLDTETWLACYLKDMKDWCESKGTATALHQTSDLITNATNRALVESCSRREQDGTALFLAVTFKEEALSDLREALNEPGNSLLFVEASESSCRLSANKLLQAIDEPRMIFTVDCLLRHRSSIVSEWEARKQNTLVILVNKPDLNAECIEVIRSVSVDSITKKQRAVVILSRGYKDLVELVTQDTKHPFRSFIDSFKFSQVTDDTKDKIFKAVINLQGHCTSLEKLVGGESKISVEGLDASLVVEISDGQGTISVGSVLDERIPYYVARTLQQAHVLKSSIFRVDSLPKSITIDQSSIQYVSSILCHENTSNSTQNVSDTLKEFSKSPLLPDRNTCTVFTGTKFQLGSYDCCYIGLRHGQADHVTALRIRPQKDNSNRGWFLFVDEGVTDEDATTLSKFNNSEHFLRLEDGKLHWTKSLGNMDVIRRHVDEAEVASLRPENVTQVEERIVLLCAEPGMGKSTLMSHLARQTKLECPGSWVIKVALNDQTKLFCDNKHLDALTFLSAATKIESPFQVSLLKFALETAGNVVVLLDGFDEIAPTYANQCCDLLTALLKTKAQKIWITSRNTMKNKLEDVIQTLALKLCKFSGNDQRNFFQKYWEVKSSLNDKELDEFITKLVKMTSQAISDRERDLLGVPLQAQMMAEVYEHHVTGSTGVTPLPEKLDLLELLDKFVDKKISIYSEHKLKMKKYKTDYETRLQRLKEETNCNHMRAALFALLSDEDLGGLHSQTLMKESLAFFDGITSGRDKTGIIDSVVNGKPRFVHRVFAEYFAAMWFAKYFAENARSLENNLFTANLGVVRDIFDRMLGKDCRLHTAVLNQDVEEVKTLLDEEGVDVNARDAGGRTALHLAAVFGAIEDQEEIKRLREMLDLLVNRTANFNIKDKIFQISLLRYADITASWIAIDKFLTCNDVDTTHLIRTKEHIRDEDLLKYVFKHDLGGLMGFYLDVQLLQVDHVATDFERLLPRACREGRLRIATLLVARGAHLDKKGDASRSPFHVACQRGHLPVAEMLLSAWQRNKSRGSNSFKATADFINRCGRDGNTPLYHAAEGGHADIAGFLIRQGADVRRCDEYKSTALHEAARRKHPNVVKLLLDAVLKAKAKAAFVNVRDDNGDTAVYLAANSGCFETFKLLVAAGGKLGPVGHWQRTALMAAAEEGHLDMVEYIVNLVAANRETSATLQGAGVAGGSREEPTDKVPYIDLKDSYGWTALHGAACFNKASVIPYLISQGADPRSRDDDGRTALHDAVNRGNMDAVRALHDALPDAERTAYFNLVDDDGNNVLHSVIVDFESGESVDLFRFIVNAGVKVTQVNKAGVTPLMLAAGKAECDIVEHLLASFNPESEGCSVTDYIKLTDVNGKNCLHHAALGCLEDVKLYKSTNADSYAERVKRRVGILRALVDAVPAADRAGFVNAADSAGHTAMHSLLKAGSSEAVKLLVQAGGVGPRRRPWHVPGTRKTTRRADGFLAPKRFR